jgi:hypothetical protein
LAQHGIADGHEPVGALGQIENCLGFRVRVEELVAPSAALVENGDHWQYSNSGPINDRELLGARFWIHESMSIIRFEHQRR